MLNSKRLAAAFAVASTLVAACGGPPLVGANGVNNCFPPGGPDPPALPYFDVTLAAVEAELCVDPTRIFVAGFSSGSWLTNLLGCARADVLRAQASSAGGLPPIPACNG